MPLPMRSFSFRLPSTLVEQLEHEARRLRMPMGDLVRDMLAQALAKTVDQEESSSPPLEAQRRALAALLFAERAFKPFLAQEKGLYERLLKESQGDASKLLGIDPSERFARPFAKFDSHED